VFLNIKENYLFRPQQDEKFSVDYHLSTSVHLCRIFPGMNLEYLLKIVMEAFMKVLVDPNLGK